MLDQPTVNFVVSSAVIINKVDGSSNKTTDLTINFGSEGSITTTQQFNVGQATPRSLTISAAYTQEQVAALDPIELNVRTLVHTENNTIWNVVNEAVDGTLSFSVTGLESFTNAGILFEDGDGNLYSTVSFGNYGAVVYAPAKLTTLGSDQYALVLGPKDIKLVVTPEPATATLSLLALAGLAARRRRH